MSKYSVEAKIEFILMMIENIYKIIVKLFPSY